MSSAPVIQQPAAGTCLRLPDVDWALCTRLLHLFAESPGVRLTYDRGELEIVRPLLEPEDDADFLGTLVRVLTEELGLPVHGGSVTIRRRRKQRGLEPDRSYWIAHAPRMAGRRRLDLRRDPPPGLAIEADVTRSSMDLLAIYAKLGVPEVWRPQGDTLTFHVLGADSRYSSAASSSVFPVATPADLLGFVRQAQQAGDQNSVVRQLREWLRQRRAAEQPSGNS